LPICQQCVFDILFFVLTEIEPITTGLLTSLSSYFSGIHAVETTSLATSLVSRLLNANPKFYTALLEVDVFRNYNQLVESMALKYLSKEASNARNTMQVNQNVLETDIQIFCVVSECCSLLLRSDKVASIFQKVCDSQLFNLLTVEQFQQSLLTLIMV
jgi:hypothetical protein